MRLLKRDDLSYEQEHAIDVLCKRRRASLWAKPGTGKTVVGATAVTDMFEGPTLVCATRRICELVWRQEFDRWEHLQHLETRLLTGSSTPKVRERRLSEPADFYLVNYELLPWLADLLKGTPWPFGSIVFDEISKMKWPGTRRFKKLRQPVLDIPVRIGLTGTPRGNAVLGLWGQGYMSAAMRTDDPEEPVQAPFARTMGRFKGKWFTPVDEHRRVWRPLDSTVEPELHQMARPWAYAMPRASAAPEAKVVPVPVSVPAAVRKLYAKLEADLAVTIDGHEIEAPEAGTLRGKLLQLCSGAIYTDRERTHWARVHDAKLDALEEIVDEMQGAPLLALYRFRHELDRMRERLGDILTIDDTEAWLKNGGTLAVHPASAAHGLNLHVGGADTLVWFTLPDSQELYEQGNRRLAREGQENEVRALVLAIQNTIEDSVARNLAAHGRLQDALLDAAAD